MPAREPVAALSETAHATHVTSGAIQTGPDFTATPSAEPDFTAAPAAPGFTAPGFTAPDFAAAPLAAPSLGAEPPILVASAPLSSASAAPRLPAFSSSSRPSAPPPLSSRLEAAQARLVAAVPPRWLEVARERPVLWMVGIPVLLASLTVLPLIALEPPRSAEAPRSLPSSSAVPATAQAPAEPASAPAAAPVSKESLSEARLAELEGKAPSALSVEELLLLSDGRAVRKRQDAGALTRKLKEQPETAKDPAVQVELWRLAGDPDTAHVALAAMAESRSAIGADLLYEVWMSRSMPAGTSELARTLLYSRDVRPAASAALAAALDLRAADSCEAMQAALPRAAKDGDRRSLQWLGKLNARRGCGEKKDDDCYPCLRKDMKQVTAAINGAKKRPSPSYAR